MIMILKKLSILLNSIKNNENICILGDYDVDGAAATSLLVRYFNHINQNIFFIFLIEIKMVMVLVKNFFKN